jgi:hypothetical protein
MFYSDIVNADKISLFFGILCAQNLELPFIFVIKMLFCAFKIPSAWLICSFPVFGHFQSIILILTQKESILVVSKLTKPIKMLKLIKFPCCSLTL